MTPASVAASRRKTAETRKTGFFIAAPSWRRTPSSAVGGCRYPRAGSSVHLRHLEEERLERDVRRRKRREIHIGPHLRFDGESAEDAAFDVAFEGRVDD